MKYHALNAIKDTPVNRISTGFGCLDAQYGGGLPVGKISIWSGQAGVGKSRTAVTLCKNMNSNGYTILYVTGELRKEQFKNEKLKDFNSNNLYLMDSEYASLSNITESIVQLRPALAVIDSVQMLREYNNGRGAAMIVDGVDGQMGLREACERGNTHLILLSQLTTDGKTKGGSELPHMCDIEVYLKKYSEETSKLFILQIENKNRYGPTGTESVWVHKSHGVEVDPSSEAEFVTLPQVKVKKGIKNVVRVFENGIGEKRGNKEKPRGFWGLLFS